MVRIVYPASRSGFMYYCYHVYDIKVTDINYYQKYLCVDIAPLMKKATAIALGKHHGVLHKQV